MSRWLLASSDSVSETSFSRTGTSPSLLGVSEPSFVTSFSWIPTRVLGLWLEVPPVLTSCSTRPSKTETMITASRDSRKTMKKMETLKRFLAMVDFGRGLSKSTVGRRSEGARTNPPVRPTLSFLVT
jgi:hypothetical protein